MATLRFIVANRPDVSVLENSKILGEENLRFMKEFVEPEGFETHAFTLDASQYGSPSRRDRQYMLVVAKECVRPDWVASVKSLIPALACGPG